MCGPVCVFACTCARVSLSRLYNFLYLTLSLTLSLSILLSLSLSLSPSLSLSRTPHRSRTLFLSFCVLSAKTIRQSNWFPGNLRSQAEELIIERKRKRERENQRGIESLLLRPSANTPIEVLYPSIITPCPSFGRALINVY